MPLIELVSHCYAKDHQHYADGLNYQLSSLVLDRPTDCEVTATICYDPTDQATLNVLRFFNQHLLIKGVPLDIAHLGRRAIGRNSAALHTKADVVWFSDVDQCYRDGIVDRLASLVWPVRAVMVYPAEFRIHRDHATGDAATERIRAAPQVVDVDPTEFMSKSYNRAIGGVQIVQGDFARRHGYLNDSEKWMQPIRGGRFGRCFCDMAYRGFCREHGDIVKVDLPGMYRIRHSEFSHS